MFVHSQTELKSTRKQQKQKWTAKKKCPKRVVPIAKIFEFKNDFKCTLFKNDSFMSHILLIALIL